LEAMGAFCASKHIVSTPLGSHAIKEQYINKNLHNHLIKVYLVTISKLSRFGRDYD